MKTISINVMALLLLSACQGPQAKAGAEKDKAAAEAAGRVYEGNGPNEAIGAARDRAEDAAREAREAEAAGLKRQGDAIRRQADVEAEKLEQQAEAIRKEADAQADAFDAQAAAKRK
ncbi:hypothetical protein ACIPPQ_19005 [Sphingopyxis sp. LARHCG72]